MKRTFTLLVSCLVSFGLSAQYFADDWTAGGGALTATNAWTTNTTDVSFDWGTSDLGSAGNFYAFMNNFASGSNAVTAWLITPAIDISGATAPVLNFQNAYDFTGDPLEVYACTDYTGGDPASDGTWVALSPTLSPGGFTWTNSGDLDLSTYLPTTTLFIGFKYTGTAVDGSKWEIDDLTVDEPGAGPGFTSIYDIQYTTATAPADSPELGNIVTTQGLVTGIILNGPDSAAYFIQDGDGAWNGLYIYDIDAMVAIGDSVEVTGEIDEFNLGSSSDNVTEMKNVSSYTVLSSGHPAPTPTDVTSGDANNEEWEGVLINVVSAGCTNTSEGFGLWSIDDGSGVIKGDDDMFAYHLTAIVGNWYQVTGIGHYSFDEAKILPRNVADISTTGWAGIAETEQGLSIYPNPASTQLNIGGLNNPKVAIYSITGQKMMEVSASIIDIDGLSSGVYQLIIQDGNETYSERLIVR